ncbi:histonelysine Nmethyltransferase SETMARlike [Trichonephila clavipes]|nr:histonelysine Nmethyltransferase SETMARlike [Trichonephila clavipes]
MSTKTGHLINEVVLLVGRPVVENVDKPTEIIEIDQHVSGRSIAQELKVDHGTIVNHLRKVGYKKKLDIWDNDRPHTSVVTRQKLWNLGWEVLMHPPYRPDLAPSDYYLFALQIYLSDKKLGSREDCENIYRLLFFANKDQDFYERGIMKLLLK